MYTVFIIDDEPWALQSLDSTLPWTEMGFCVTGRYTNALTAWEALCLERPDVAFIDIRMPDLTGLEFARRARDEGLNTLFVIVSGHDEFKYAQQAIRLNVLDYCLKPVDAREGREVLSHIIEQLSKDASMRYAALCECILERAEPSFLFNSFPKKGDYWQVAILRHVTEETAAAAYRAVHGLQYLPLRMGARKLMFIFNGTDRLEEETAAALSGLTQFSISIGVSRAGMNRSDIVPMILQAQSSSMSEFIQTEPRFVLFSDAGNHPFQSCTKTLIGAIEECDVDGFIKNMEHFRKAGLDKATQVWHLSDVWNDLMDAFIRKAPPGSFADTLQRVADHNDLCYLLWDFESMCTTLCSLMEEFANAFSETQVEYINDGFLALLAFVDQNYHQQGIRLTELAKRFHLNLTYCSELFRKVTGMTYTDYVTRLRMEHALRSIKDGNKNLQRLAFDLGYGDYFTFSKRFKQYHGVSPSQFIQ